MSGGGNKTGWLRAVTAALALLVIPAVYAQSPLPPPRPEPIPEPMPMVEPQMQDESGWPGLGDLLIPGQYMFFRSDALFFHQSTRPTNQPVIMNTSGETLLNANQINGSMDVMPRFALGISLEPCSSWEAVYFGSADQQRVMAYNAPNELMLPPDLGLATLDFFQADQMQVSYTGQMYNVEANYWMHNTGSRWSWMAGCRFVRMNELLNIHANDVDTAGSDYRVSTWNSLFGAQLGTRWGYRSGRSSFDITGKMGAYQNAAGRTSSLSDFDNTVLLRDYSGTHHTLAMVADLDMSAVFQLTDHLSFRAGYMFLWLENVMLAADQLDFTDTPTSGATLNNGGGALFQGAHLGLEARW